MTSEIALNHTWDHHAQIHTNNQARTQYYQKIISVSFEITKPYI